MTLIFYFNISEEISLFSTIRESSKIIYLKDQADMSGSMVKRMMVPGKQVKWMVMASSFGIMEVITTKENIKKI